MTRTEENNAIPKAFSYGLPFFVSVSASARFQKIVSQERRELKSLCPTLRADFQEQKGKRKLRSSSFSSPLLSSLPLPEVSASSVANVRVSVLTFFLGGGNSCGSCLE